MHSRRALYSECLFASAQYRVAERHIKVLFMPLSDNGETGEPSAGREVFQHMDPNRGNDTFWSLGLLTRSSTSFCDQARACDAASFRSVALCAERVHELQRRTSAGYGFVDLDVDALSADAGPRRASGLRGSGPSPMT